MAWFLHSKHPTRKYRRGRSYGWDFSSPRNQMDLRTHTTPVRAPPQAVLVSRCSHRPARPEMRPRLQPSSPPHR
eukprot:6431093-Pyramimonas_sp.AAC.1